MVLVSQQPVIAARFKGRDSIPAIAEEYGRQPHEIEEAIRWGKQTALQRLRSSSVFYIEESLCNCAAIQRVFVVAQIQFERHYDHFPLNTFKPGTVDDYMWLDLVGEHDWIALTKDKKMRYQNLERASIKRWKIREFAFSSGSLGGEEMARLLELHLNKMFNFIKKQPRPFVAGITNDGIKLREDFSEQEQ